jgi:hypothetical protein
MGERRESVIDRGYDQMQGMRAYKFPHLRCATGHAESWRLGLCFPTVLSRIRSHHLSGPLVWLYTKTSLACNYFVLKL